MGKIGEFGFRVDFDPALIYGLFKAFDVFASIAMEALDVKRSHYSLSARAKVELVIR